MARRIALLFMSCVVACSSDSDPIPLPVNSFAYSNSAIMAVAIATAHQGTGFFDNAIACPRRGVVEYWNDALGRRARFSGCDTGNNVVIDGDAYVRGTLTENGANQTLNVTGTLTVRIAGLASTIGAFSVSNISFNAGTTALALRLKASEMRVVAGGVSIELDARTSPQLVLAPADVVIGSVANSANSVDALTDADLRRLVVRDLMLLSNLLFGESIESARGAHQHTMGCGTTDVAPEAQKPAGYVRLANSWNSCVLEPGILVSGTFQQVWDNFSSTQLSMRITGPITIGGGLPITTFSSIEWKIIPPTTLPGAGEISGTITAGGKSRTFVFTVTLDD